MFHGVQSNIIPSKYRFVSQKITDLTLVLFKSMSMQCDRQKSVIILFYLGSSMKMGAGTETSEFGPGYGHKIMMEVRPYLFC